MSVLACHEVTLVLGLRHDAGEVLQRDAVIVIDDPAVGELDSLALDRQPRIEAIDGSGRQHLPRLVPAHRCLRYHSRVRRRPSRRSTLARKPSTRSAFAVSIRRTGIMVGFERSYLILALV